MDTTGRDTTGKQWRNRFLPKFLSCFFSISLREKETCVLWMSHSCFFLCLEWVKSRSKRRGGCKGYIRGREKRIWWKEWWCRCPDQTERPVFAKWNERERALPFASVIQSSLWCYRNISLSMTFLLVPYFSICLCCLILDLILDFILCLNDWAARGEKSHSQNLSFSLSQGKKMKRKRLLHSCPLYFCP